MAVSKEYIDHLVEALEPLGAVSARRMFGGAGLFYGGLMFALIAGDELYLKAAEEGSAEFEEAGSRQFSYLRAGKKMALKSYWLAPDHLLDDNDELLAWGRRAVDAALAADKAKQKPI